MEKIIKIVHNFVKMGCSYIFLYKKILVFLRYSYKIVNRLQNLRDHLYFVYDKKYHLLSWGRNGFRIQRLKTEILTGEIILNNNLGGH